MSYLQNPKNTYKIGMFCAIACAVVWGALPLYWKSLIPIPSGTIIFYRIFLVAVLMFFLDLKVYGWEKMKEPLRQKGVLWTFIFAGIVISLNWGIYIWAVNAGFLIQTSIGYYIEPLFVCIFGVVFFKERMDKYKLSAFLLACAGALVMVLSYGKLPLIAISLAVSFATYAAIKKKLHAPALLALFYETVFLAPIALAVIIYKEINGQGAFANGEPYQWVLLALVGVLTALPLSLFAMAANRVTLVALGITEYISPSIALLMGIFLFREPFDRYQLIGFIIIWIGLVIFTIGGIKEKNEQKECDTMETSEKKTVGEEVKLIEAGDFRRVTGGGGGEALLIIGSEKTALYDTGMAYCAPELIENIKRELAPLGRPLDYVLLSHTHYDHDGGLPYLRQQWPKLKVFGSAYGKRIMEKEGALRTMRQLSEKAAVTYRGEGASILPYSDEDMKIDCPVGNGDSISLGDRVFKVYETPGHTNCSLTYYLEAEGILLSSESSGMYLGNGKVHTSILSSFQDARCAVELCRSLGAKHIYVPHSLQLPQEVVGEFWDKVLVAMEEGKDFILDCRRQGLSDEGILERSKERYWKGAVENDQPLDAFMINAKAKIQVILREFPEEAEEKAEAQ